MEAKKLRFPVAAYPLLCSVGSYLARNRCLSIAWRLGTPEERNQGENNTEGFTSGLRVLLRG